MNKRKLKRTSRHEAGHFVMHWILGMKPTAATVSDEDSGFVLPTLEDVHIEDLKLFAAAGYAAEFINLPLWYWLPRIKRTATDDTAEDLTTLFGHCSKNHKSERIIFYEVKKSFAESWYFLRHYRKHLSEATEALYRNTHISEVEAAAMFSRWGAPGKYGPSFRLFSMIEPTAEEIAEDIRLMSEASELSSPPCPY